MITMGLSGAALDVDSRLSISLHDLSLGLRAPAKFRSIRCFFFWGKVEVNRAILLLIQQLVKRLLFLRGSNPTWTSKLADPLAATEIYLTG